MGSKQKTKQQKKESVKIKTMWSQRALVNVKADLGGDDGVGERVCVEGEG